MVPGTGRLSLDVVDSPRRDTSGAERSFWLVPILQSWSEGTSTANVGVSGSGSGAPATPGDATWLHASFDPTTHDPRAPDGSLGHWSEIGIVGNTPIDPADFGEPAGSVPAAPYLGPVVFSSESMEAHINQWLADPVSNLGWLLLGDETVVGDNVSSARGFASRESATPPELTFEYRIVPEPTGAFAILIGCVVLCERWRRRQRS